MNKRIEWEGKTHPVAFVFNFIGDEDPADITLPAYRKFEEKHPGRITELTELYWNDTDAWLEDEIELNKEQIETLQALLDCVNDWHSQEKQFFSAMIAPELVKEKINNWESKDVEGLKKYKAAVEWWGLKKNIEYLIADIQDRIAGTLDESSQYFGKFTFSDDTEILDSLYTIFFSSAPYDYESLGLVDDDGEIDIPEDEIESLDKFLASNALLIDLKNASNRFHRNSK
jgi:hypothetical protein